MICIILVKEITNLKDIQTELTECLLNQLNNSKMPLMVNLNDFFVVNEIFSKIRACTIGENSNLPRFVMRLTNQGSQVSQLS